MTNDVIRCPWCGNQTGGKLVVDDLVLDTINRTVTVDDKLKHLSPKNFDVLRSLMSHAGNLVKREQLVLEVWGEGYYEMPGCNNTVNTNIKTLRKIVGKDRIQTIQSIGYRLVKNGV